MNNKKHKKEVLEKMSEIKKGKNNPMFGRKHSDETKEKIRNKLIGNKSMTGRKHSKETLDKMSKARIEIWEDDDYRILVSKKLKGIKKSDETIKLMKEKRKNWVTPIKDTSIEIKIQNLLDKLGIEYLKHKYVKGIKYGYQCDIFIPSMNIILECDGDYWHGNPEEYDYRKLKLKIKCQRILDFERTNQMEELGYKVIRLWENEIKKIDEANLIEVLNE